MSRPKRLASQKVAVKQKLDLSDLDEDDSEGDFSSASSDEYNPDRSKNNNEETFEEPSSSEVEGSENSETEENNSSPEMKQRSRKSQNFRNRSSVATLRKEAINKYGNKLNSSSSGHKLQDILKKAQYSKTSKVPNFDCSGGLNLSDSEEESSADESASSKVTKKASNTKSNYDSINEESGNLTTDLKAIHDNLERMKNARQKLSNYAIDNSAENENENNDVANLLAMGENSKKTSATQKRKKQAAEDSDSDNWEEVEDDEYKGPKESVEILLDNFGDQVTKKGVKPVDVEAQLKRKFNRKRKELQEFLHKTEFLSWLVHCNYVNTRLNSPVLMEHALKMLPSTKNKSQCYPKDKTDIYYFTQITKWFKQTVSLNNTEMYCTQLKERPNLLTSLAIQMKFKAAICRRDYVLMFVTLLRAIGIQCRMVQSLNMDPKICPKSALLSLSKKDEKESTATKKVVSKQQARKNPKSKKSGKNKPVLDQFDGVDDKMSKDHKKAIKIKGSAAYKVDDSFIDVAKIDKALTPKRLQNNSVMSEMSPKVKITLNSPNHNKASLPEKLKKNVEASKNRLSQLVSPRKTRSASRGSSPTVTENIPKIAESSKASKSTAKKESLKVFSPRRLRSRSKSSELEKNQQNGITKANETKKVPESKKPNLKALAAHKTSPKAKQQETLKVFSPRRLRSRSKSTENNKPEESSSNRNSTSRKRESTAKDIPVLESKKAKIAVSEAKNSRKRSAVTKIDSVEPKKAKKKIEKLIEEEKEELSDDSLKYFKNISSSANKRSEKKASESPQPSTSRQIDRRILSSDDENTQALEVKGSASPSKSKKGIDVWVEVYAEKEDKWLSIDVFRGKVDNVKEICQKASHPLVYVFAWNNDKSVKDVSARYVANLNTTVRKMRVERDYLNPILRIFNVNYVKTNRDVKEDEELNKVQYDTPKPTSIAEFKNHPLYVLSRHLLKFQAIYPPEPPILGYIRDEAIYPRDCCFNLHSRETWLKEARTVKLNEQPYKIVKTIKWDRAKNKMQRDIPLELFGIWQTKDYEPPVAENGIVPRNAYGNVELFKKCMLPIGTVHLQLPGLNKVCKKLGVDCSQAIVGFDSSGGWPYPVYDGFIVCKEFEEKVIDAWNRDQDEAEEREREKYEKRVYGNWKKLIKGLIIRERLMQKYNNFKDDN